MLKHNQKQEIRIQIALIVIFLIFLIPLTNNETLIHLIFPNLNTQSTLMTIAFFVLLVSAVYAFLGLQKNLKQRHSSWRYLVFLIILIWFTSNIRVEIGEKLMTLRPGIRAIEFQIERSKLSYQKDTLGVVNVEGFLTFRNFSDDTIKFRGILYADNFVFFGEDRLPDLTIPNDNPDQYIIVPPKASSVYPLKIKSALEQNSGIYPNYHGTIDRIKNLMISNRQEQRTFKDQ